MAIQKGNAGADCFNYCKMSFHKNNHKINNIAFCNNEKYEIDGEPVTKEDFNGYIQKHKIKKDIEWISIDK